MRLEIVSAFSANIQIYFLIRFVAESKMARTIFDQKKNALQTGTKRDKSFEIIRNASRALGQSIFNISATLFECNMLISLSLLLNVYYVSGSFRTGSFQAWIFSARMAWRELWKLFTLKNRKAIGTRTHTHTHFMMEKWRACTRWRGKRHI